MQLILFFKMPVGEKINLHILNRLRHYSRLSHRHENIRRRKLPHIVGAKKRQSFL
jgi:hypothetical protein